MYTKNSVTTIYAANSYILFVILVSQKLYKCKNHNKYS